MTISDSLAADLPSEPESKSEFLESQNELLEDNGEQTNDSSNESIKLSNKEIYKELRVRGYDYGPSFQGLLEADGLQQNEMLTKILGMRLKTLTEATFNNILSCV